MDRVDLKAHISNLVDEPTTTGSTSPMSDKLSPQAPIAQDAQQTTQQNSDNYSVNDIQVAASPLTEVDQIWKIVYEMIKMHNSERTMSLWYRDAYLERIENGVAYLSVSNAIQKDWIQDNNRNLVCNKIESVIGYKPELMINVRKSVKREEGEGRQYEYFDPTQSGNSGDQTNIFSGQAQSVPRDSQSIGQPLQSAPQQPAAQIYNNNLNPKYTLENFVVGSSNQLAHAVAEGVVSNLGASYNPLFYYGPSGVGKTHLMQAIGNHVLAQNPNLKILYVSIETFMNEMIEAIRTRKNEEFRQKYRPVDVLIIDDIQFISTYKKTQEELFNTFNTLYQNNKQIVIASDRPPKEIDNLPDRLRTRFEGGMVVDIQPPDYETRVAMLRQQVEMSGIPIRDEVLSFIAHNIENSVRELEGAINKVITKKRYTGIEPTDEEVAKMLQVDVDSKRKRIKPNMVIDSVCNVFDISVRELKGKRRTAYIALARQTAMYLLREELELPLEKIAHELNRKDHTTVLHACDKVKELMESDSRYKEKVDRCKALLGPK
ncbi:MAG: chromosomal replication initiator protein DnaA [Candidatus Dojkabacteria bacterium]|nr:MAG: chromosomal replication initiator protein DnaA [Candidatus Dojkabacteria bacterium]